VYSRIAEDAEAVTENVKEELVELRRSVTDRMHSETMQRKIDNLEKENKILKLENILESQLHRERDKDQKIAELEEKVEAIAQLNDVGRRRPSKIVDLPKERSTFQDTDTVTESETEEGRNDVEKSEDRTRNIPSKAATRREIYDEPTGMNVKDETRHCEKCDEEAHTHCQVSPGGKTSCRRKFPFLLKSRSGQSKVT